MNSARAFELCKPVTTPRLVLEPLREAHADALFEALQDRRIYQWIAALPPRNLPEMRQRWRQHETRIAAAGTLADLNWVICRASDGQYLGKCDADVNDQDVASNVGYLLFPAFWGQGYATEAVRGLAAHLEALGVVEQRALVTLGNDASARVLEKADFIQTRIIPDNDLIRGQSFDDVEYVRRAKP